MRSKTIRFSVRGQGGHIHVVRAVVTARTMQMSCSCGEEGPTLLCPHAERLLDGDGSIILSRNTDEIDELIDAAWTLEFGRWVSIRRAYCGRTVAVQSHLAEASMLRPKVRRRPPRRLPTLAAPAAATAPEARPAEVVPVGLHGPPPDDASPRPDAATPAGAAPERDGRKAPAPPPVAPPSVVAWWPVAKGPPLGVFASSPPPPMAAQPTRQLPPFVKAGEGGFVPLSALVRLDDGAPAPPDEVGPAAQEEGPPLTRPPPRQVDPRGTPYRVWRPSPR